MTGFDYRHSAECKNGTEQSFTIAAIEALEVVGPRVLNSSEIGFCQTEAARLGAVTSIRAARGRRLERWLSYSMSMLMSINRVSSGVARLVADEKRRMSIKPLQLSPGRLEEGACCAFGPIIESAVAHSYGDCPELWLVVRRRDAKVPAAKRILTALCHCARARQSPGQLISETALVLLQGWALGAFRHE